MTNWDLEIILIDILALNHVSKTYNTKTKWTASIILWFLVHQLFFCASVRLEKRWTLPENGLKHCDICQIWYRDLNLEHVFTRLYQSRIPAFASGGAQKWLNFWKKHWTLKPKVQFARTHHWRRFYSGHMKSRYCNKKLVPKCCWLPRVSTGCNRTWAFCSKDDTQRCKWPTRTTFFVRASTPCKFSLAQSHLDIDVKFLNFKTPSICHCHEKNNRCKQVISWQESSTGNCHQCRSNLEFVPVTFLFSLAFSSFYTDLFVVFPDCFPALFESNGNKQVGVAYQENQIYAFSQQTQGLYTRNQRSWPCMLTVVAKPKPKQRGKNPAAQLLTKCLKGCKVLTRLGELALFHALTHVVMDKSTLWIPGFLKFKLKPGRWWRD